MLTKKIFHFTGIFYLIIILSGLFSEGYIRNHLLVPEASHFLMEHLKDHQFFLRIGFSSDLFMVISDVIVAGLFFILLKPVNETLSFLAAFFRLVQASVIGMNLLNFLSPLTLLNQVAFLENMDDSQINFWTHYLFESHKQGYLISQFFFSINCILMAYLLFHSKLFPKFLGVFVGLAGIVYLTDAINQFLFPGIIDLSLLLIVPIISELSLCLYLLLKGQRMAIS